MALRPVWRRTIACGISLPHLPPNSICLFTL